MRCDRLDDLLPAYLDGDLSSRLNDQVAAHLDDCDRCRLALDQQHRSLRLLDTARYAPSIDLWADFSRRLQERSAPKPSPWRYLWQPGLASAVAAVVVSLVLLSAPEHRSSARWLPAPAGSVEIARSSVTSPSTAAPSALMSPPASVPSVTPTSGRLLDGEGSGPTNLAAGKAKAGPSAERPRRNSRRRAGVTLAKESAPASPRTPRVERRDRDEDRRPLRVAMLPPATSPVGGPDGTGYAGPDVSATGPLDAGEALMAVQQDAASDQIEDELFRMARHVIGVSGKMPASPIAGDGAGT